MDKVTFRIRRKEHPDSPSYWEDFVVPVTPGMTVLEGLQALRRHPVNARGEATAAVVFEEGAHGTPCGLCVYLIGGKPRNACRTLLEEAGNPLTIEPLSVFPVIRDLWMNREKLTRDLMSVEPWIPLGHFFSEAPVSNRGTDGDKLKLLGSCTECGACLEACPQVKEGEGFVGAAVLNAARYHELHPLSRDASAARKEALLMPEGVLGCMGVGNCQKACPEKIPLNESIAVVSRKSQRIALKRFFLGD